MVPPTYLPPSTSFTPLSGHRYNSQSPINYNRHVQKAWKFNGGVLKITLPLFFQRKKSHWRNPIKVERRTHWFRGHKGGQRPSKSQTVWRWNASQTYYWGERKTTSHNCLGDGKPFRLPGKDDQRRRRKLHSDDCVCVWKEMQQDLSPPDSRHDLGWECFRLWLYLFKRAMKIWTNSLLIALTWMQGFTNIVAVLTFQSQLKAKKKKRGGGEGGGPYCGHLQI